MDWVYKDKGPFTVTGKCPAIIILLPAGFIAGALTSDVNPQQLLGAAFQPLVSLSVAVILYDAGLGLDLRKLYGHTRRVVIRLITLGIPVTWAFGAVFVAVLPAMSAGAALMTGAILVVSGPTVVAPLLRFIRPTERLQLFRSSLVQHRRDQVQQRPGEVALSDHDHLAVHPDLAYRPRPGLDPPADQGLVCSGGDAQPGQVPVVGSVGLVLAVGPAPGRKFAQQVGPPGRGFGHGSDRGGFLPGGELPGGGVPGGGPGDPPVPETVRARAGHEGDVERTF